MPIHQGGLPKLRSRTFDAVDFIVDDEMVVSFHGESRPAVVDPTTLDDTQLHDRIDFFQAVYEHLDSRSDRLRHALDIFERLMWGSFAVFLVLFLILDNPLTLPDVLILAPFIACALVGAIAVFTILGYDHWIGPFRYQYYVLHRMTQLTLESMDRSQ